MHSLWTSEIVRKWSILVTTELFEIIAKRPVYRHGEILVAKAETLYWHRFYTWAFMLIKNLCLSLSIPETLENSFIETEELSLATKISRLLCIGVSRPFEPLYKPYLKTWLKTAFVEGLRRFETSGQLPTTLSTAHFGPLRYLPAFLSWWLRTT